MQKYKQIIIFVTWNVEPYTSVLKNLIQKDEYSGWHWTVPVGL